MELTGGALVELKEGDLVELKGGGLVELKGGTVVELTGGAVVGVVKLQVLLRSGQQSLSCLQVSSQKQPLKQL